MRRRQRCRAQPSLAQLCPAVRARAARAGAAAALRRDGRTGQRSAGHGGLRSVPGSAAAEGRPGRGPTAVAPLPPCQPQGHAGTGRDRARQGSRPQRGRGCGTQGLGRGLGSGGSGREAAGTSRPLSPSIQGGRAGAAAGAAAPSEDRPGAEGAA